MTTEIVTKAKYQLLPDLTEEEYQTLKADIAKHGILVPIEKDEAGNILDGHHRIRAWRELKAEGTKVPQYSVIMRSGMTEQEKRNHIRSLNLLRRHLSKEQMATIWVEMRTEGMTYQAIADTSGVDDETVRKRVSEFSETQPEVIIGKDGKHYPATKSHTPKTVIAINQQEEQRALKAIAMAGPALPRKVITTKRAERIGREQDAERKRLEAGQMPRILSVGNIQLRDGTFPVILNDLAQDSVDLICTDPPYSENQLSLWPELAQFSSRVLKPSGWLITYSGQSHLELLINILASELTYVWVIAQINGDNHKHIIHRFKVYSRWKPILIFAKPPVKPLDWVNDVIKGGGRDKRFHDWQQSETEALYFIKSFSLPGQLVVDPFLGSGTTALAAHKLGRHFIGCDIDPANITKTLERINEQN